MKYVYPAIFMQEDNGFSVSFPDLEGCYTCGDNLQDAITMAEDALALCLFDLEITCSCIPEASSINSIPTEKNEFASYIACDTLEYQKRHNNKAIKKTLSIPEWLNEAAVDRGINFSAVLQEALKERLGIS